MLLSLRLIMRARADESAMNSERSVATYISFATLGCAGQTLSGAVVATDPVSVDADYDNGVTLHHATRRRRSYEHAAKRVEASVADKYTDRI